MRNYLLSENEKLNIEVDRLIKEAVEKVKKHYGLMLRDLILFGSLAREEGSADFIEGKPIILSDTDLLAILRFYFPKHSVKIQEKKVDVVAFPFFRAKKPHGFEKFEWSRGIAIIGENPYKSGLQTITAQDVASIIKKRLRDLCEFQGIPDKQPQRIREKYKWSKTILPAVDIEMYKAGMYDPSKIGRKEFISKIEDSRLKKTFNKVFKFWSYPTKYESKLDIGEIIEFLLDWVVKNINLFLDHEEILKLVEKARTQTKYKRTP